VKDRMEFIEEIELRKIEGSWCSKYCGDYEPCVELYRIADC